MPISLVGGNRVEQAIPMAPVLRKEVELMLEGSLSKRFSAQDATFLYFEKEESPMHIGSIGVFEGEIPYEQFDDIMRTNFYGAWCMIQTLLPHMKKQGGGSIINIASIAGLSAAPMQGIYSVTKA